MELKKLDIQQLHLILHNMRIYGVSQEKREQVIKEINSRNKNE